MMVNVELMGFIHYNTRIATFVWLSSRLLYLKSNELSYMVKIKSQNTHFSVGLCIEIELTLQPCMLGVSCLWPH
jgi:hypothetical protein